MQRPSYEDIEDALRAMIHATGRAAAQDLNLRAIRNEAIKVAGASNSASADLRTPPGTEQRIYVAGPDRAGSRFGAGPSVDLDSVVAQSDEDWFVFEAGENGAISNIGRVRDGRLENDLEPEDGMSP